MAVHHSPTWLFFVIMHANPTEREEQAATALVLLIPSLKYSSGILLKRKCLKVKYLAVDIQYIWKDLLRGLS